ncbi:MAG TPA: SWIM zinc finger family protein [Pyrinomonadaceae bacterium]|nr:SWIM zinc finger family protein [Pyrinomonadaceae bacterium]
MTAINTSALTNLEMFKTVFIETPVGTIEVIKGYDGTESWIRSSNVPAHAVGVRASSPQRAFEHQLAVGLRYAPEVEAVEVEPIDDAQKTVVEIFASRHVATVVIGFEYESGNVRYYSAITNDRGIPHRYRVRVEDSFETGTRVTVARCNCPAKSTCRHILKVAEVDAARTNREIYPNAIAKYRAHRQAASFSSKTRALQRVITARTKTMEMTELQQTITAIQERLLSMENECRQLQVALKNLNKSNEKYSSSGLFLDAVEQVNAAAVSLDYADAMLCTDLITENSL